MDKLLYFPSIDQFGQRTSDILFSEDSFEKTASHYDYAEPISKFLRTVKPDTNKYLYMLLHALGAGEVWGANVNGDYFPEKFLEYDGPEFGHKTFESLAKLYKHHENKDPNKSYGDVLFSHYDKNMHRVLLVVAIDRDKAPDICSRIELNGEYPDVSMGCKVPYDICSICGNKAKSPAMYCDHAKYEMNRIYPDGRKVFVINPTPRFFDISQVFIGAEKPAKFLHKIAASEMCADGGEFSSIEIPNNPYNGLEKSASVFTFPSALIAEKLGYSTKEADMIKSIPAGETGMEDNDDKQRLVLNGLRSLRKREGCISDDTAHRLAKHPVKRVLTTLTSKGIALDPREFQKIILIRLGHKKLAQVLDNKNIEFDITDDLLSIEPMDFDISDIDPEIEKIATSIMPQRSDLQPHLFNRTLNSVNRKSNPEKFYEPSRTNVAPSLLGIAGLYLAYKKGLLKAIGPLDKAVENLSKFVGLDDVKNPAFIIPIATAAAAALQGTSGLLREKGRPELIANSDMLKMSSARDLALVAGLYAAPHIAREQVRQEAIRGEQPGLLGSMVYNYTTPISIASTLSAPAVSEYLTKAKDILGKTLRIGKMFKGANKKNKSFEECFQKEAEDPNWKFLLDNVVSNEFWSNGNNIKNVSSKTASIGTTLGLAMLGNMEE